MPQRVPWIQSVEGRDHKLSVWKAGHQVQAAFFDGRTSRASKPFILLMPIPPDRQLFEPAITECAVATNAESFVVVREQAGTLFAWHRMLVLTSCSTVKSSEKAYIINDGEMPLSLRNLEKLEINFQLYREGSSGATGGKSGGGCGCN